MILGDDLTKLTDFGIARMRTSDVRTQTGLRMGSPRYMSPEQVLGKRTDHQSDIFSLGIVLYEMLAGKTPFSGDSLEALMYQTIHFVPPPPSRINPDVPEMLDLVIAKMLEKTPEDRYQGARELASDLRQCEKHYGLQQGSRASAAAGLHEPPPSLNLNFDSSALKAIKRSRRQDEEDGLEIGAGTLGISQTFDSFEATRKLAKEVGMVREFEDFSASNGFATTIITPPEGATEARLKSPLASDQTTAAENKMPRMSNREKLVTSSILLAATFIAILIVVY